MWLEEGPKLPVSRLRLSNMRQAVGVVALVIFTSCGAQSSSSSIELTPSASSSSSSGPATSLPTSLRPTSAPSPTQTPAAFSCTMPFVSASQRIYDTGHGTAGFLEMPAGSFRADPSGSLTEASSGQYFVGGSPALPGSFFTPQRSWDSAAKRWLPVPPQQVAPDGASYVYQDGPEVHLVSLATGTDNVIFRQPSGMPAPNMVGPWLLAYVASGVYFSVNATYKGSGGSLITVPTDQVGVWRIDPTTPHSTRVLTVSVDGLVTDDGAALWAVADDSASPPTGTLMRYDLETGKAATWFSVPGSGMDLLGLDPSGDPLVWTYNYQGVIQIWIASGPSATEAIDSETYSGYVPYYAGSNLEFGPLVADQRGVWFGSTKGLFLFDRTGMHRLVNATGIPVGRCA